MNETDLNTAFERFREHLPIGGDLTLMILKGHLLIEEQLNLLLATRIPRFAALEKAELSAIQRIMLAEAVIEEERSDGSDAWLWPAVRKLNKLRNDIAHTLSKPGINDRVLDFVRRVPLKLGTENLCHNFEFALWTTCSEVHLLSHKQDATDFADAP